MKVIVYPHDLDMGGSQTNAIELAAAVSALGHECIVFGRPGTLCTRIEELGLEFIVSPDPGRRPSMRVAAALDQIVREREIDVIHGYEWPPMLEAELVAARNPQVAAVGTVMSMAVAPFIPRWMPLVVGTQQISAAAQQQGYTDIHLIEPPVDLEYNRVADSAVQAFRERWALDEGIPLVGCVSRLVPDMKAEGILTTVEVAGTLATSQPFQLIIVGDGKARVQIEAAADAVNSRHGRRIVVLTGELADPRAAYAATDVMIGMGGSALRSLAFGKPLIVQGERGYFRALTPDNVREFTWQGWHGVGTNASDGHEALRIALEPLLADPLLRTQRGDYGRDVVEQFSLKPAARIQAAIYKDASAGRSKSERSVLEAGRCITRLGYYYARQALDRARGTRHSDDFNALSVAITTAQHKGKGVAAKPVVADGPILYFPGVGWDTLAGTDRHLVTALARTREVVWVDTPHSVLRARDRGIPAVTRPIPNVVRLRAATLPGVQRPLLRAIANRRRAQVAERLFRKRGDTPSVVLASTTAPMLDLTKGLGGVHVYYATDDYVAAAGLWGVGKRYLHRSRERNLASADRVFAVSRTLARALQRGPTVPRVLPNGADIDALTSTGVVPPAKVPLSGPIAGVIGQFNSRTDLSMLKAVQRAGIDLLLVGPDWFTTEQEREDFAALTAAAGVHRVGQVDRAELPAYLQLLRVGLTPYADSVFNRRSHPLKTIEYLAAGVPVVTTDVADRTGLDPAFVSVAHSTDEFVVAVRNSLVRPTEPERIRETARAGDWVCRADQLMAWLQEGERE